MKFRKKSLRKNYLYLLMSSILASSGLLSGCSSDGGSSSSSSDIAVDSSVPSVLQSGESAQGTVALVSINVAALTSVDNEAVDVRTVSFSDSSDCSPKLTFTPSSQQVTVDGDPEVFNVSAPAGNCLHQISFSGDGITTSTSTADVNVVQNAIVTVGLFDNNDVATASVVQGGILKVKFSSPADWENVTGQQSYTVSSETNGITYANNPCTLTAPQEGTCTVTATIGENVATGAHGFNITPSSTSVPVDVEDNTPNLPFTVNTPGQFAFTGEGIENNEVTLTIGADPVTVTVTNSGDSTITNIDGNTGDDADKFDVTNPAGDANFCGDIDTLAAEASCELNLALSDQAEADATYDFEVTGDNASPSTAILTVNTEADEAGCSGDNPTCRVFVTESSGGGNLQSWAGSEGETGITAANNICKNDSENPDVNTASASNFKAWLSTDNDAVNPVNAKDNIGYLPTTTYIRVESAGSETIVGPGGLLIADELNRFDNSIGNINNSVWTGTFPNGEVAPVPNSTCGNWTTDVDEARGFFGSSTQTNQNWTSQINISCFVDDGRPDNVKPRLYCFESPAE